MNSRFAQIFKPTLLWQEIADDGTTETRVSSSRKWRQPWIARFEIETPLIDGLLEDDIGSKAFD